MTLTERWEQLEKNDELLSLLKSAKPFSKSSAKPVCLLDFNGVLIERDVSPKMNLLYKEKIRRMFDPLVEMDENTFKAKLENAGLQIKTANQKPISESLREFVSENCYAPKKGTPARKVLYDLAESAFENGEIKIEVHPDAELFLKKLGEKRFRLVLSVGSLSLLSKIAKGIGFDKLMDTLESTIPYGNAKVAETYLRFYFEKQQKGQTISEALEDEYPNVQELVLTSVWLQKHDQTSFRVVWVDRENEFPQKKELLLELQQWVNAQGIAFSDVFERIENLKTYRPQ